MQVNVIEEKGDLSRRARSGFRNPPGHGETQLAKTPTSVSFSPTFQIFVVVLLPELNEASRSDTDNPVKR